MKVRVTCKYEFEHTAEIEVPDVAIIEEDPSEDKAVQEAVSAGETECFEELLSRVTDRHFMLADSRIEYES